MSPALLLRNATVFTPLRERGEAALWKTASWSPGAVLIRDGRIAAAGPEADVLAEAENDKIRDVRDLQGKLLTPGFVDCHTHPVFHNHRAGEFRKRIRGASYEEISAAGGGIRFSVRDLRAASDEQLLAVLLPRLDRFLSFGTTTVEAKSGYGLSVADEIRSLRVLQEANRSHPVDLVPTFLGAHEIPDEYRGRRERYLDLVVQEMLPQVTEEGLARFVDVFCEAHVFTQDEARTVLQAGKDLGLGTKIHADQLTASGGAELAAALGAASADHLEHTPPDVDERLGDAGVVPVLLPGADFFLASARYGPARRLIDAGLPVAIATDFNPGTCMSESMPMMLTLACLQLKMSPEEAMTAATLHAARAIASEDSIGSLERDKLADIVVWDAVEIDELPYHFGVHLVEQVFKRGSLVYSKRNTITGPETDAIRS